MFIYKIEQYIYASYQEEGEAVCVLCHGSNKLIYLVDTVVPAPSFHVCIKFQIFSTRHIHNESPVVTVAHVGGSQQLLLKMNSYLFCFFLFTAPLFHSFLSLHILYGSCNHFKNPLCLLIPLSFSHSPCFCHKLMTQHCGFLLSAKLNHLCSHSCSWTTLSCVFVCSHP